MWMSSQISKCTFHARKGYDKSSRKKILLFLFTLRQPFTPLMILLLYIIGTVQPINTNYFMSRQISYAKRYKSYPIFRTLWSDDKFLTTRCVRIMIRFTGRCSKVCGRLHASHKNGFLLLPGDSTGWMFFLNPK